ncbi:hypothetical protein C7448_1077 [Tenacibaculum gallaicum]|uniref:Uncharacterized protein n=1 Tax=Tenacibaculum gallaicum TaxID=561505 RepID=A0A3E0HJ50_9FLAO|nr:hypothetical protein [Tenacibaculum gallaicum]REH46447.1 hypothetical protein C7448_1077 [Tenacibaculum gallaicum]
MKKNFTLLFILISFSIYCQNKYEIKGFSNKYKGLLTIEKGYENEIFKKGCIAIFESKTNTKIIEIQSDELTFELEATKHVKTNILKLPYGEQSILISKDFNFDGIKDLAIMNGQFSCYHGPSFNVYLEINNKLTFSPEFTRLAQEYCGMFQTNAKTKTIHTITKSGCCWHQYSTFKVVNDVPTPTLIIEENAAFAPFFSTTTTQWNGNKKNTKIIKTLNLKYDGVSEILSFKLIRNQKQVVLFSIDNQVLNYALVKPNGVVEFSFPLEMMQENYNFNLNKTDNTLTFKNRSATYQIYQKSKENKVNSIGILVTVNGKNYDLKGNLNSIKGSLKTLKGTELNNLISE